MKIKSALLVAAFAASSILPASAVNLVLNGDFSDGFNDFTSDYTQVTVQQPTGPGGMWIEGTYTVLQNPFNAHNSWQSIPAGNPFWNGSTGNNTMLIVNGASTEKAIVWQTTAPIAVSANTLYNFQAEVTNLYQPNLPATNGSILDYDYSYDGGTNWSTLATIDLSGDVSGVWALTAPPAFNTGVNTSILLRITNAQTALNGNDFAIGLVSLSTERIPEPGTVALLAAFGMASMIARRRTAR